MWDKRLFEIHPGVHLLSSCEVLAQREQNSCTTQQTASSQWPSTPIADCQWWPAGWMIICWCQRPKAELIYIFKLPFWLWRQTRKASVTITIAVKATLPSSPMWWNTGVLHTKHSLAFSAIVVVEFHPPILDRMPPIKPCLAPIMITSAFPPFHVKLWQGKKCNIHWHNAGMFNKLLMIFQLAASPQQNILLTGVAKTLWYLQESCNLVELKQKHGLFHYIRSLSNANTPHLEY